jgi:hypothetical protein
MQVNSMQDYVTMKKRQILAATYNSVPPPQARRSNALHLSVMANNATQYQRFIIPTLAQGSAGSIGGATFSNMCCLSNSAVGAPGAFQTVTPHNPVNMRVTQPPARSVVATRIIT